MHQSVKSRWLAVILTLSVLLASGATYPTHANAARWIDLGGIAISGGGGTVSAGETFGNAASIRPSGPTRNAERTIPMKESKPCSRPLSNTFPLRESIRTHPS